MATAIISVGSNLGEKHRNCRRGIRDLDALPTTAVTRRSRFYRTSPVDFSDQDWFVNAAVEIRTVLDPFGLLEALLAIQARHGGKQSVHRFGPRHLDMDLVFFDDRILRSDRLTIPHPRMDKRRFVLQPVCDIDPGIVHPVFRKTVAQLLADLADDAQEIMEIQ